MKKKQPIIPRKRFAKHRVTPKRNGDELERDSAGNLIPKKLTDEPEQVTQAEQWVADELNRQWLNSGFYYFETE